MTNRIVALLEEGKELNTGGMSFDRILTDEEIQMLEGYFCGLYGIKNVTVKQKGSDDV